MRIGIDASVLERTRTGISRYLSNLLREWDNLNDDNKYYLYFKDKIPSDLSLNESKFIKVHVPAPKWINKGLIWENIILPLHCRKDNLDVFFSPHYTLPLLRPSKKMAVTIYDISYIALPENVPLRNRLFQSFFSYLAAKRADAIITGLEFTRREIYKYFKVETSKIKIIPAGAESKFVVRKNQYKAKELKNKYNLKDKVILSLGLIIQRRQQDLIIKAFSELAKSMDNVSLFIAGPNRTYPFFDIEKIISDLNLKDKITYIPYLPEEDLIDVYNMADLYVYISLYEGEGLPIREAMACGLPVLCSDFFKDIVRDCAYISKDSKNPKSISDEMKEIITNTNLREKLVEKGLKLNIEFTWKRCAIETLNIFRDVLR